MLEAQTVCAIFQDNAQLCSELSDNVVQHFVHCIETHVGHVEYLHFLWQTIVQAEGQFIRKCQDMVMQELVNVLTLERTFWFFTTIRLHSTPLST